MAERDLRPRAVRDNTSRALSVDEHAENDPPQAPEAPGAVASPQHPGQVPDHSSIPGQPNRGVPRPRRIARPLTEAGTAQAIMGVFAAKPGQEGDPARFEQATASYEELRKAYPAQLPPARPAPGYFLQTGDAMASEMQAVDGGQGAASIPANTAGEAYSARPGGGTAALGAPARTDASGAQVGSAYSPGDAPAGVRSPEDATAGAVPAGAAGDPPRADSAPAPGDLTGPAGTLAAAKPDVPPSPPGAKGGPSEAPQ